MSDTVYLLAFDRSNGSSDEWNFHYTPIEAFKTAEDRQKRIDAMMLESIEEAKRENQEHEPYDFMLIDRKFMPEELIGAPVYDERLAGCSTLLRHDDPGVTWIGQEKDETLGQEDEEV
jgi:hypothetical protein